jgi:uncharacterized protein YjbJ (UPF0337 family)
MDKDRIKGKMEDVAGRVERQAGEWTGDEKAQAEGLKHQVKGKARNMAGQIKDAARDAAKDAGKDRPQSEEDRDLDDREEGAA